MEILKSASEPSFTFSKKSVHFTVLVASLGYFVDIYDLLLFGIVRIASLKGLGISEDLFLPVGVQLVNFQMIGMLVGGVLWGVLGDKRGRVSVLFGSILIYSVANILNAFVNSVEAYSFFRFLAGLGLAGELGAAITLVSESMSKETRGWGTTVVSSFGILGAVFAGIVGECFSWRTSYLIGGLMGLVLLFMRLSIYESNMFKKVQSEAVKKGDLRMLVNSRSRFLKYILCILVGVPIWYIIGVLVTFSPELARALQVSDPISAGKSILFCYFGGSIGNLAAGSLSQVLKSRKKVILIFLLLSCISSALFLSTRDLNGFGFYALCTLLGFATGYWVVFMTASAEQFGINLRSTVATTVPNFVRASVVVLTLAFQALQPSWGLTQSAGIVGGVCLSIALMTLLWLPETFHQDLNFMEKG